MKRDDLDFRGGGTIPSPCPFSGGKLRGRDLSFLRKAWPGVMKRSLSRAYSRPEGSVVSTFGPCWIMG